MMIALVGFSADIGAIVVLVTVFAFILGGLVTGRLVVPSASGTWGVVGADTNAGCVVSRT